jgi:hypothetical protein
MTATPAQTFQAEWSAAILSPERATAPAGLDAEGAYRFRVYRNNLRHGLAGTLAEAYPVVRRLVGGAFFEAAAGVFIERHPPRDRTLAAFGAEFAEFLGGFQPAQSVPYLADVARLERARIDALHAADADPLDPEALVALGEAIVSSRFEAHPACRLVQSPHPILSIWAENSESDRPTTNPAAHIEAKAEAVLITRPHLDLRMLGLSVADAAFAKALLRGESAEAAHEVAHQTGSSAEQVFDPMSAFRALLDAGAFRGLRAAPDSPNRP